MLGFATPSRLGSHPQRDQEEVFGKRSQLLAPAEGFVPFRDNYINQITETVVDYHVGSGSSPARWIEVWSPSDFRILMLLVSFKSMVRKLLTDFFTMGLTMVPATTVTVRSYPWVFESTLVEVTTSRILRE